MRIIGAAFGGSGPGPVIVIVEGPDRYLYAQVQRDGRVEPQPGSHFPKDGDFYGHDPRRFLAILGGFNPEAQVLKEFIPFTGEWAIAEADAENLFKWDREARGLN